MKNKGKGTPLLQWCKAKEFILLLKIIQTTI